MIFANNCTTFRTVQIFLFMIEEQSGKKAVSKFGCTFGSLADQSHSRPLIQFLVQLQFAFYSVVIITLMFFWPFFCYSLKYCFTVGDACSSQKFSFLSFQSIEVSLCLSLSRHPAFFLGCCFVLCLSSSRSPSFPIVYFCKLKLCVKLSHIRNLLNNASKYISNFIMLLLFLCHRYSVTTLLLVFLLKKKMPSCSCFSGCCDDWCICLYVIIMKINYELHSSSFFSFLYFHFLFFFHREKKRWICNEFKLVIYLNKIR